MQERAVIPKVVCNSFVALIYECPSNLAQQSTAGRQWECLNAGAATGGRGIPEDLWHPGPRDTVCVLGAPRASCVQSGCSCSCDVLQWHGEVGDRVTSGKPIFASQDILLPQRKYNVNDMQSIDLLVLAPRTVLGGGGYSVSISLRAGIQWGRSHDGCI